MRGNHIGVVHRTRPQASPIRSQSSRFAAELSTGRRPGLPHPWRGGHDRRMDRRAFAAWTREHRGVGYASAAVAQVTGQILDSGTRACLFTDQANPTSNRIYQAIGYEPVVDMANFSITPA